MNREERILKYIETHSGCTKTIVKNSTDMAEGTADKILKKLIEKDKKVICIIDDVNPRIHHLYRNGPEISKMRTKKFILSKIEEQINNQMYTRDS